jgi:hypothetical protein
MTRVLHKLSFSAITLSSLLVAFPILAQTGGEVASQPNEATEQSWFEVESIGGNQIDVGDFVVGPGKSEIQLEPGQTYTQIITVTNRISDNRTFKLEIEDISGTQDGSEAVVLLGKEEGPYGIRDFISFPSNTFTLNLGERARIPVTIRIPANAEPGGYYGSVLVSTVRNTDQTDAGAPQTPVIARVGSLFFLTVGGNIAREGETKDISTIDGKFWYQSGPIELAILFENTGSVHTNPYGEISITNMFGEEVGYEELEPWYVLPKSLRSREIIWNRDLLLGRYEVTARINRGYDDIVDEVSTSFWVVPVKIIIGALVVLFAVIFAVRFLVMNFEFKRKGQGE